MVCAWPPGSHHGAQGALLFHAQVFELALFSVEEIERNALEWQAREEPQADRHGREHGGRGDDLRADRAPLVGDRNRDDGAVLAHRGIGRVDNFCSELMF